MNNFLNGAWFNPDYDGEGFTIMENDDGQVLLYWFTYTTPNQMWLMGVGNRIAESGKIFLDVTQPIGGDFADPDELENVTEVPWGSITLDINDDATLTMTYNPNGQPSGSYDLIKLFDAGNGVQPPESENIIKVERKMSWGWNEIAFDDNGWISGFIPRRQQDFNPRKKSDDWRITVVKGELNISKIDFNGPGNPAIQGLNEGDRITENDPPKEFSVYLGPFSLSRWELINIFIESQEHGLFFNSGYQISVG